jgi:hypothetical protein
MTAAGMAAPRRAGGRARRLALLAATGVLIAALATAFAAAANANPLEGEAGFCRSQQGGGYADSACTLPASGGESRFEWVPAAGHMVGGKETIKNSTIESDDIAGQVVCKTSSGELEFAGATGLTAAFRFSRCMEEEAGCGAGASPGHGGGIDPTFTGSLEANAAHEVVFAIPSFSLEFECTPTKASFFVDAEPGTVSLGHTNTPIAANAFKQILLTAHEHETEGASFVDFGPGVEFTTPFEFRTHVPAVTALSPRAGAPAGGNSVTLTGLNFTEVESVSFGGTPAVEYTVESPTQITATAPAGHGQDNVTVKSAAGTSAAGRANEYSYTPILESVSPSVGPVGGGTTVTITGQDLNEATGVTFGGKAAASWELLSPETIRAVTPPGAGNQYVQVQSPSGTSAETLSAVFSWEPPPTVTKLSTKKGPVTGGTTVVIKGENFYPFDTVMFGDVPATSARWVNGTLEVVSPPNAAETVDITVVTPGGTSPASSKFAFKYGKPEITHVSPASGPLGGGTVVTIEGAGFVPGAGTSFLFKKGAGTSVSCESTTVCTATSPAASKPGAVNIQAVVGKNKSGKGPGNTFTYE